MRLREKQILFAKLWALLILKAQQLGYEVVQEETFRSPEETKRLFDLGVGHKKSLHGFCLAGHLGLFKDGVYLRATEDYRPLGEWWEQQHELCAWGGRFGDGVHFSLEHEGIR